MQRLLPRLVLFIGDVRAAVSESIALLTATSQRFVPFATSNPILPARTKGEA